MIWDFPQFRLEEAKFREMFDEKLQNLIRCQVFFSKFRNLKFHRNFARWCAKVAATLHIYAWSGAFQSCRTLKILHKEPLATKIGFDPAENGPSKVLATGIPYIGIPVP